MLCQPQPANGLPFEGLWTFIVQGFSLQYFVKIDVCTKVMWQTLVHVLSFKITKGDECQRWNTLGKKELRCT